MVCERDVRVDEVLSEKMKEVLDMVEGGEEEIRERKCKIGEGLTEEMYGRLQKELKMEDLMVVSRELQTLGRMLVGVEGSKKGAILLVGAECTAIVGQLLWSKVDMKEVFKKEERK